MNQFQNLNREFVEAEYKRLSEATPYTNRRNESGESSEAALQKMYRLFSLAPPAIDFLLCCVASVFGSEGQIPKLKSGDTPIDITPEYLRESFDSDEQEWADFCFGPNELFELGLLYHDLGDEYNTSEMRRPIRVHPRLVRFLTGAAGLPSEVIDFLRFPASVQPGQSIGHLSGQIRDGLDQLTQHLKSYDGQSILHFIGPDGTDKSRAAQELCRRIDSPCLQFDLRRIIARPALLESMIQLTIREARLFEAAILIPDWHLLKEQKHIDSDFILQKLTSQCAIIVLTSEEPFFLPRKQYPVIDFRFEAADHSARVASWSAHLNGEASSGRVADVQAIAGLFKFNDGQIRSIVDRARLRSRALSGHTKLSDEAIIAGCREESSQKLAELAVKVETRHSWDFLILPEDQKTQLRELCNHMKFRSLVYEDWAYHTRVAAPGLNALFSGPPGTGKTLAASIIANELGLDLYKIDLSTVVSKYIGETEKNLSKIFKEAEASNAVLFFDEADSLFGKRSAVRDAHDRYANIQVGYLLQKMEEFPGMTILASNLIENIDDAFMRRLHFSVDFPFPAAPERERIWRVSFPEQAPLADDIDYEKLGKRLKVPGGNIRNIALHAAFHAAADNSSITIRHIARAAKREYEKEGRSLDS